ncbi:response regulator [Azospirillum sp.]|uniref:response regulator n=1 Tax=Azospirillum sp. TaxID=34012 RepID=UPI003D7139DF
MATLALIEDDALIRTSTEMLLQASGHRAIVAENGNELAEKIAAWGIQPDALLCDFHLGQQTALEAVPEVLREIKGRVPVYVVTGDASPAVKSKIQANGWYRLLKPLTPYELLFTVSQIERSTVTRAAS